MSLKLIQPDWPAPAHVTAFSTTRLGGLSCAPFDSLNLGDHVDDDLHHVNGNRQNLTEQAHLPNSPLWLTQTHSTTVISAKHWQEKIIADGITSHDVNQVCSVLTADCLPILICDKQGQQVAAVHAGWRGLTNGIIDNAIQQFTCMPQDILVWLGPAIGPDHFEVGQDVYDAFVTRSPQASSAFSMIGHEHYLADIYALARQNLCRLGVENVYGGQYCTVCDPMHFFSYRRDGITGRMASLIWIAPK